MGALAGVLIWSKLRLSTNMPRSAYADPEESQVEHPEAQPSQPAEVGGAAASAAEPEAQSGTGVDTGSQAVSTDHEPGSQLRDQD